MGLFEKEYEKLNSEQREAVDYIDGPLLVIAGPGTGKTQLLSMRVANILRKSDVSPQNILCLTFTNKATENMKERLVQLVGKEANGVFVRTFHSLAAEIMNRYPEYFWSGARLSIAPDAIQLEIIQNILKKLPHDHPLTLKFAGQYTLIKDVKEAINLAKEAGTSSKVLRNLIENNLDYIGAISNAFEKIGQLKISKTSIPKIQKIIDNLPKQKIISKFSVVQPLDQIIKNSLDAALEQSVADGKNTALSAWKRRWVQPNDGKYEMGPEIRRNNWWLGLCDVYEKYQQDLHSRAYYDYADMLLEVIDKIEAKPDLKAELQEQFQYVLIDEYQDTNGAQLKLARLIADHFVSEGKPNLMVVGDDDQSIFKFQGAELSNMAEFSKNYDDVKVVVLVKNYRSSQAILDAGSKIIENSSVRLVDRLPIVDKTLVAESNKTQPVIKHLRFRTRAEQMNGIAEEASKLFKSNESVLILARSHSSLRDLSGYLLEKGVPIRYEQSNNIFDVPSVKFLVKILRLVESIRKGDKDLASELLSEILRHPMWRIKPEILWRFAITQSSTRDWFAGLAKSNSGQLKTIGLWLEGLASQVAVEPASIIIEQVMGLRPGETITSPFKSYYLDKSEINQEFLQTLSAVQLLRVIANEFAGNKHASLKDFVDFLDLLETNGQAVPDTTPYQSSERFVELMSVHKAKGLEFDCVIVIDASEDEWSPKSRGRIPPANLPLRRAEDDDDDYARLMYVACTRAKNKLIVSSYEQSIKGDSVASSHLISSIQQTSVPPIEGKELIKAVETALRWPKLNHTSEKQLLKQRLENYTMSVTHLINFLDVSSGGPQTFFERNILRLPSAKSPALSLGTAVHSALQTAQNLVNQDSFDMNGVLTQFESTLLLEGLPRADHKKQLARGKTIIKNLFETLNYKPQKGGRPEYALKDIRLENAVLNGKLDNLEINKSGLIITDFKTGQPLLSMNAKSGEAGVRAWKHRLQLTYYALLIQLDPHFKDQKEIVCQMMYVEAKSGKELTRQYKPTPEEITELGNLIQVVWKHIQNLDLPDAANYEKSLGGIEQFKHDLLNAKI